MRVFFAGMAVVWSLIGVWHGGLSEAQEGLTRRDTQGPVTVAVTLIHSPTPGAPIKARVVLDTHSAALDGVAFEQAVVIRTPDGAEVPPTSVEQASGSGHHREVVLVFPPSPQPGSLRILVRNVGGVAERTFSWEPSTQ
jgi:hypothetical protein